MGKDYTANLQGVIDLHVHGNPSLIERKNPWDYVLEMDSAGYRACVIQEHNACTAGVAYAMNNSPVKLEMDVFGTLVMNASVGGIDVAAVEAAYRMGAKRISFPTTSSPQQLAYLAKYHLTFGGGTLQCGERRVSPLDENEKLTKDAMEVLDYVRQHPDLILSTGYMSPTEIDTVVEYALSCGIRKVIVDHPYLIVEAPAQLYSKWAKRGAYIELEASTFQPITSSAGFTETDLREILVNIPKEQLLLSSDLGQKKNIMPAQGLGMLMEMVQKCGNYTDAQMIRITQEIPAQLLYE